MGVVAPSDSPPSPNRLEPQANHRNRPRVPTPEAATSERPTQRRMFSKIQQIPLAMLLNQRQSQDDQGRLCSNVGRQVVFRSLPHLGRHHQRKASFSQPNRPLHRSLSPCRLLKLHLASIHSRCPPILLQRIHRSPISRKPLSRSRLASHSLKSGGCHCNRAFRPCLLRRNHPC